MHAFRWDPHGSDPRRGARRHPGPSAWEGFPHRGPRGFGPGFGPGFGAGFGPGGPRARRGDVRTALLGLLAEGASNGYGLIRAIADRTEGAWTPSPGSVYPTLAQLVDEGLVSQADGPRGAYTLTDEGRKYVEENEDQIETAFENASRGRREDDLGLAFKKLAGAVMQFRAGATPEQRARATARVDELRRELYAILGE